MKIKLMTFNTQHCLNFITQQIDYDVMANAIKACDADIVALNEIYDEGPSDIFENQTKILAQKAGYKYYYFARAILFGGENPYGNAILSRYPITSLETVSIPEPAIHQYDGYYEDRCLLKATLEIGDKELSVYVIHVGLNPDEAQNAISEILRKPTPEKLVIMGDFNLTPDDALIKKMGEHFFDAAQLFDKEKLTYPSDAPEMKIDYIFTSKNIKVLSADVPEIIASDHRPHIAEISL